MNVYQRYSEVDKKYVTYHTKGLIQGENLPPINNHFHWCRSTITYLIDNSYQDMYNITNQDAFVERIKIKNINKKIKEYEDKIRNDSIENMYIIQPNGNVYYFSGKENSVTFTNVDLNESIITHNHLKDEEMYRSFGEDDFNFIKNNDIKKLRIATSEYDYEISKKKSIDLSYNEIYIEALKKVYENNDLEIQHEAMLILKERGYVDYERRNRTSDQRMARRNKKNKN